MLSIRVPATTANLGPGFDTLGMAVSLFLEVKMARCENEHKLSFCGEGQEIIQNSTSRNLLLEAALLVFKKAGVSNCFLNIEINNNIPLGKGLGSSAAAIVAGMFAANHLLDNRFSSEELIKWAIDIEGHADNIIPAAYGGLTTAMLYNKEVYYQKIDIPTELKIIVAVPDFVLETEKSRAVLPEKIGLKETVANLQRACYLIASIYNRDYKHFAKAMDDAIYQQARKQFIPGFDDIINAAVKKGALGVALSGAGPSIVAFTLDKENDIGESIKENFLNHGVNSKVYYLKAHKEGIIFNNTGSE